MKGERWRDAFFREHSWLSFSAVALVREVGFDLSLDFLHFGGDHHGIALSDLLSTQFLVVKVALVLITVTMY